MWFIFALIGAFFKSSTTLLRKAIANAKIDPYVYLWFAAFVEILILSVVVLIMGQDLLVIVENYWMQLVGAAFALNAAGFFNIKALEKEQVSYIAPINAFIPIFTLLIAWVTLGELPPTFGIIGVAMVFIGVYIVNLKSGQVRWTDPIKHALTNTGARFAFGVAVAFAISTVFTKSITNGDISVIGMMLCLALIRFAMVSFVPFTRKKPFAAALKSHKVLLISLGISSLIGAFFGLLALANTFSSYAISVRRFDIIITVLLGWKVFKDTNIRNKVMGSLIMVAGVIIIVLA